MNTVSIVQHKINHLNEQKKKIAAARQALVILGNRYDDLSNQLYSVITDLNSEIEELVKNA